MSTEVLREIPVDLIDRNPENPRIVFRPGEMSQLIESIQRFGVQVPISVYREGRRFVLIDGERRWKSSIKLNKKTIPAKIQDKPDELGNLLLMFNIHALREQWDLLTIALKLPKVIEFLATQNGRPPKEKEVASETGLSLAVIRRCKLLMELPDRYRGMILRELEKPKSKQRLTEDFFIEMERSLKTVSRAMPQVLPPSELERVRKLLIRKFESNVITNIVQFRLLAKIARAANVDASNKRAEKALYQIFSDPSYSIEEGYEKSVAFAYFERDLVTRTLGLAEFISEVSWDSLDKEARTALSSLQKKLSALVRGS